MSAAHNWNNASVGHRLGSAEPEQTTPVPRTLEPPTPVPRRLCRATDDSEYGQSSDIEDAQNPEGIDFTAVVRAPIPSFFDTLITVDTLAAIENSRMAIEVAPMVDLERPPGHPMLREAFMRNIRTDIESEFGQMEGIQLQVTAYQLRLKAHESTVVHSERLAALSSLISATMSYFENEMMQDITDEEMCNFHRLVTDAAKGIEIQWTMLKPKVEQHLKPSDVDDNTQDEPEPELSIDDMFRKPTERENDHPKLRRLTAKTFEPKCTAEPSIDLTAEDVDASQCNAIDMD